MTAHACPFTLGELMAIGSVLDVKSAALPSVRPLAEKVFAHAKEHRHEAPEGEK